MRVSYTHTISCGHRLVNHPGKCRFIHGHNYKITLYVDGPVQPNGMVMDYADIKEYTKFLDKHWDHHLLLWEKDPIRKELTSLLQNYETTGCVASVPFNPTAENMALYLLRLFPLLSAVKVKESDKTEAFVER